MKNKFLLLSLVTLSSLFVGCNATSSSSETSSSSSWSSQSVETSSKASSSSKVKMEEYLINNLQKLHDQTEKNYTIKYDGGTGDKADIVYCTKNAIYRDANNEVDVAGYAEDDTCVFWFGKNGDKCYKGSYQYDSEGNYIKDLYNFTVSLGAYKDKVAPRFDSLDVERYKTDLTTFGGRTMIEQTNNDLFYFILCLGWDQTFKEDSAYAFVSATEDSISYEFRGTGGVVLAVSIYDIGTTTIEGSEGLFENNN